MTSPRVARRHAQVLLDGQIREQASPFRDEGDPDVNALVGRHPSYVATIEEDSAGGRTVGSREPA